MSLGVLTPVGVPVEGTGTGPPVRAPPLVARPPPSSDMSASSSARSGVNGCGFRIASSRANVIADLVRLEMRVAGCIGVEA